MHIIAAHQPEQPGRARYLLILMGALCVFAALLIVATATTTMPKVDMKLSLWVQTWRSPSIDQAMVLVTMLGDWALSIILLGILLVVLVMHKRWWLTIHLVCVYLSTTATVSLIKVLTNRARPAFEDVQLVSFSFPSGHTAGAALIVGLYALIISQGKGRTYYLVAFAIAGIVASLVALSRVYLSAHWTSDVLAGICLAVIFLTAFAWQLNAQEVLAWRFKSAFLMSSFLILTGSYWLFAFSSQALRYGVAQ